MKYALLFLLAFLRPAALDFASMGAGLTGGILGMNNADNLPAFQGFMPSSPGYADADWITAMNNMSGLAQRNQGLMDPSQVAAYQSLLGIDMSPLIGAGAQAGSQYGNLSNLAGAYGQTMQGQAGAIANTAFDPQNQLHDYLQNQVVDNSRAATSARGIGMSPYAAGAENTATSNFNMDWQNQQLARQMAGSQASMQDLSGAAGFYGQQPGLTMQAGAAPIMAQQGAYSAPFDYASMFAGGQGQITQPYANLQSQIDPYLGLSASTTAAGSNYNMNDALQRNMMQQQSQYGLWGGGQSSTPFMGGNQSGAGNPMNWMGMGGMGGGMGG